MKNNYLSRLNPGQMLTKLFATLLLLCSVYSLQAQANAEVSITAPAGVVADYPSVQAVFGPGLTGDVSGPVVAAMDTATMAFTACAEVTNDLTDAIALIDRGGCGFVQKVLNAQTAGAIAVIVCNNDVAVPNDAIAMGGDDMGMVNIPAVMLPYEDCQEFRSELGNGLEATLSVATPAQGTYCNDPIVVGAGVHTVDAIDSGWGGAFTGAVHAAWYEYTPTDDLLVTVSSCNLTSVDTRLVVMTTTDCTLSDVAFDFNDDCDAANDNFASELTFLATAGQRYLIYWDDPWSSEGFDFEITEGALQEVEGTFNVDMSNETVGPDGVSMVVGGPGVDDIGDVEVVTMTDDDGDGVWTGTYTATTLDTIGYAFMNGALDPANIESVPDSCGLDSGFGFNIRPLIVTAIDAYNVPTVCFSLCTTCPVVGITCDDPNVIIFEDFEGQTVGEEPTSDFMIDWPGTSSLGTISDNFAASGDLSHRITGTGADVDPVYLLSETNITTGHYVVSWNMLVEEGNLGYYNFQKDVTPGTEWAFQLYFDGDGTGRLEAGSASAAEPRATFNYPVGEWFPIVHVIDVDNNLARVHVNGTWVSSWPLNWQPFNQTGVQSFAGVNFYPANMNNLWYVDDFLFAQIPEPGDGLYCQSATPVTPGMYTMADGDLDCFGGGLYYDVDDDSGLQSRWLSYTADEDGYITVSSCNGGDDTRAYILGGRCDSLAILSANDDRCELEPDGDAWASLIEAPVTAGETYYIYWDDYWNPGTYDWELTFTSGALPEGNFCESAIAVDPGVYTIAGFGEASAGGGALGASSNPTSAVFAPQLYAGAAWYSYTPSEDETIVISSCDSGEDTYVNVYTGECGNVTSLELIASNDDFADCAPSSQLELEVTAGTTYYIEWMDLFTEVAHDWELSVLNLTTVTFQVDATRLVDNGELAADGIHLAGAFNDFTGQPMTEGASNVWTLTFDLEPGTYTYKFQNGLGNFESINTEFGDDCTVGDFGDREVTVEDSEITLDLVCYSYCVTCDLVLDTDEEVLKAAVDIFPNPAKDVLNVRVDLPEAASNLNVRLVNTFGQVVSEQYLGQLQSDNIELDLSNVPAGAYMIQVRDGQSQYTESVIIQK